MAEEKNLKCHFKLSKAGLQQTIGGSKFQSKGLFTEGSQQPAPPPSSPSLPPPASRERRAPAAVTGCSRWCCPRSAS